MSALRPSTALVGLALAAVSCIDPVHDDAVDALGPEKPGVRRGPQHRPGQPCLVCHGGDGPGSPDMVVAGTVFATRGSTQPVSGASVEIHDAKGDARTVGTNEAGNFYVFQREWSPVFPLHVRVTGEGTTKEMTTRIGRDGSCATCHVGAGDVGRMPGVFVRDP